MPTLPSVIPVRRKWQKTSARYLQWNEELESEPVANSFAALPPIIPPAPVSGARALGQGLIVSLCLVIVAIAGIWTYRTAWQRQRSQAIEAYLASSLQTWLLHFRKWRLT